jgi:hypothetical protein
MRKFKVTSGAFQKFIHIEMLIDDLENISKSKNLI